MARVINAQHATLIGTPAKLRELLGLLAARGATVLDLRFANIVVLDAPLDRRQLEAALPNAQRFGTTPRSQRR